MFEAIARDVTQAWRSMVRMPMPSAVVVLSLGVGIGVNTVVFSWIQALVLKPIPGVSDASRLYLVEPRTDAGLHHGASWLEYRDFAERLRALSDLIAFRMAPLTVGESSTSERTYGLLVSGNYFRALGLEPATGRLVSPGDVVREGGESIVVISYDYWQTRFGGSPAVLSQTLRVNDRELAIVGVTPERFQGTVLGLQFDLWVPATLAPVLMSGSRELADRTLRGYYVMGRLARPATAEHAHAEASAVMHELARLYPESNATLEADVIQFWRASRGPQGMLLQGLGILQAVMLVLLLAVCGNAANLVLARAASRQREIGVRLAVGAGSWRLVRLLLVENLALGLVAAAIGALIAVWGTNALRAVPLLTTQFPVRLQTSVDLAGLGFAMALGVVCAVVFGAAPAAQLGRVDPVAILRSGSAMAPRRGVRSVLMASEVALALVVLVAAALFFQSFRQTQERDPGFRRDGLLLAAYDLTGRAVDGAAARQIAIRVLEQIEALPDVESAAIATSVPLDIHGLPVRSFMLEGRSRPDQSPDRALTNTVTPGYFATMGIPVVSGSDFVSLRDTTQPPQAVVNQTFAVRYLDGAEPLGRQITIGDTRATIVGVARDSLYESFSEAPTPIIYLSYRDRPSRQGEIHVRARVGDEALLTPGVRGAVRAADAALPIYNVRTMGQHVDMSLALRKIPARMFAVLGPLILVLAAIGIYAVVAYNVSHRTAEVGVRLALGASGSRVVSQIVRESLQVILAGAVVGWLFIAYIYTHLVRGGFDVLVFAGVPLLLILVATLSAWLPARHAAAVDPMVALRAE